MKKKFDHAAEAAKKFITLPEEVKETEQPEAKKRGRTKSAYELVKEDAEAKLNDSVFVEATEETVMTMGSKNAPETTKQAKVRKSTKKTTEADTEAQEEKKTQGISATVTQAEQKEPQTIRVTYSVPEEPKPLKKSERKAAFSVWMDKKTAEDVKLYSAISGVKMTDLIESAVREYMKNHALTYKQRSEYRKREEERIKRI